MPATTLYLVRHGEQEDRPDAQDPGDPGLSGRGRQQAQALAERLAALTALAAQSEQTMRFDGLHHSRLRRATETAHILAAGLPDLSGVPGLTPHACEHVLDRTPMPAPGSPYPPRYDGFFAQVPQAERDPGAERLTAAVAVLCSIGDRDRTDLIVTHNFVIGWFVRHVLDAPHWRWLGLNQDNCGLTVLRWETGRPPALISFNDTGHLSGI